MVNIVLPASLGQLVSTLPVDLQNLAYELYVLIAANGNVNGPAVSVTNDIPKFADTTGKLLSDSGLNAAVIAQGPASAVNGDVPSFNGAGGKILQDSGRLAATLVNGPGVAVVDGHIAVWDTVSGTAIKDGGSPPTGGDVQASRVKLTGGNVTTVSAVFVDLTGATITITTGAHRCEVYLSILVSNNNAAFQSTPITLVIDGVNQGGTQGIINVVSSLGNPLNGSFSFLTDVLSAGSHTFKIQWFTSGGTATAFAGAAVPLIFSVIETGLAA